MTEGEIRLLLQSMPALLAAGSLLVALLSVAVSYQQARNARAQTLVAARQATVSEDKLRLDNFDKRFAIYTAAVTFRGHLARQTSPSREQLDAFQDAIAPARFLLAREADQLLNDMYDVGYDLQTIHLSSRSGSARRTDAEAQTIRRKWIVGLFDELGPAFARDLQLTGKPTQFQPTPAPGRLA